MQTLFLDLPCSFVVKKVKEHMLYRLQAVCHRPCYCNIIVQLIFFYILVTFVKLYTVHTVHWPEPFLPLKKKKLFVFFRVFFQESNLCPHVSGLSSETPLSWCLQCEGYFATPTSGLVLNSVCQSNSLCVMLFTLFTGSSYWNKWLCCVNVTTGNASMHCEQVF